MIRKVLVMFGLMIISSFSLAATIPQPAMAATDCDKKGMILTLKPWYYGLTEGSDCKIKSFGSTSDEQSHFIWTIGINIVEDLLQLTGYVAVGFIIYGGFVFMTSSGSPERAAAGRKVLINSIIGLVIAMSAVLLVNLVARTALGIQ